MLKPSFEVFDRGAIRGWVHRQVVESLQVFQALDCQPHVGVFAGENIGLCRLKYLNSKTGISGFDSLLPSSDDSVAALLDLLSQMFEVVLGFVDQIFND